NEIRTCAAGEIAAENKPAPSNLIANRIVDWAVADESKLWLPKKYADYKQLLTACDGSVRTALADPKRLGPDPSKWVWGTVVQSRFPHPLSIVPFVGGQFLIQPIPIPGSGQTPNVGAFVSMRLIASPGSWDATRHVIPLGESGDPKSPFFKDEF